MRVDFLAIHQSLARAAVVHGKHAVAEVGLGVLRVCLHRFVRVAQRVLGLALRVAKRVLRDTRRSGNCRREIEATHTSGRSGNELSFVHAF